MADKGLALIFGPGKKGSKIPPAHDDLGEDDLGEEHDHEDDDEEKDDDEELRDIAKKMLDAFKSRDEDLLVEALEDFQNLDKEQDEHEDEDE